MRALAAISGTTAALAIACAVFTPGSVAQPPATATAVETTVETTAETTAETPAE